MTEKITSAAIRFKFANEWGYATGRRHCDCFNLIAALDTEAFMAWNWQEIKKTVEQGFITSEGRYVDRREAKAIAIAANQLIVPLEGTKDELFSEDIW